MTNKNNKRLEDLHKKAVADGHWPLASASHAALANGSSLDLQINVVGSIHECGMLRNRLEPFWQLWRKDDVAWTSRCVERLRSSDRDYWAVASLLGMNIRQVWPVLKKAGYVIKSVRACPPLVTPLTHFITVSLTKTASEDLWAPVFELGWEAKSGEIIDSARWRAIIFDELKKKGASIIGKADGTNFLRAALPHGSWRVVSAEFELVEEAVIPIEKTVLKKA
jgi:hypothetical protein